MQTRGDAIVRNALKGGDQTVVLGVRHDLMESVRAQDPQCDYVRPTTHKVAELVNR
jgi:hypothetical protein